MNQFDTIINEALLGNLIIEATHNIYDPNGKSYKKGTEAELDFSKILTDIYKNRWRVATRREETIGHMDFVVSSKSGSYGIEVKSNKDNLMQDWMLIEFQGVEGHPGWIYGDAKLLAYERPNGFKLYRMDQVRQYAEDTVNKEEFVNNRNDAQYKVYQRPGRQDIITFIDSEDLDSVVPSQFYAKRR
jgi:hypothetical protein